MPARRMATPTPTRLVSRGREWSGVMVASEGSGFGVQGSGVRRDESLVPGHWSFLFMSWGLFEDALESGLQLVRQGLHSAAASNVTFHRRFWRWRRRRQGGG